MRHIFTACALSMVLFSTALPAAHEADLEGRWFGTVRISGTDFRMLIEFEPGPDGILKGFLFSLDQGGQALLANRFDLTDDILTLEVSFAGLLIKGRLDAAGQSIDAEIRQGGATFPLALVRVGQVPGFPRTQNPVRPYPYREQEVAYSDAIAGTRLVGTLSLPAGDGPFPAALLISGSGPQDRDETAFYHRPFRVLADHLARRGIAVLRVDDRGFGASTGDFTSATSEDFVDDALSGFAFLSNHPDIDPDRIGLIGHSEGGLVAPMAAAVEPRIAFIVLLAGPGVSGAHLLTLQQGAISRSEGGDPAVAEVSVSWSRQAYRLVIGEPDNGRARDRLLDLHGELDV